MQGSRSLVLSAIGGSWVKLGPTFDERDHSWPEARHAVEVTKRWRLGKSDV